MDIDIIGLQRRMRQLGEIRMGHTVDTGKISKKTGKPILRPEKIDKFRVTAASRHTLEEVAKLYGGTVQPWTPANGGPQEWEVYTATDRLPVIIPPKNSVTQCYEMYKGSKCVRRCNGRLEEKSDRACMCDPDERDCSLTTRLNVMLRDVPGLGVWLLTSHGYYAAVELPPVAEFLASTNGYVDAWLTMELKRVARDEGPAAEFMVPKLDIAVTPAQLLAGQGAISPQALDAGQQRAVASGQAPAAVEGARPAVAAAAEPAEAAPLRDFVSEIKEAPTRDDVVALWNAAKQAKVANAAAVEAAAKARVAELEPAKPAEPAGAEAHIAAAHAAQNLDDLMAALTTAIADGFAKNPNDQTDPVAQAFVERRRLLTSQGQQKPYDPNPAGPQDPERLWAEIVTAASLEGFERTDDIEHAFATRWNGDQPGAASAMQLQTFLDELRDGKVRPPQAASVAASSTSSETPPF